MQIPVMISVSTQVLPSVHGCLFPCPENSVSSLANLEARRGEASGQCAMPVRTGDGTVLITLEKLLSLTRESHLPWHCCNPFHSCKAGLPAVFGYAGRPGFLQRWTGQRRSLDKFLIRAPFFTVVRLPPSYPPHPCWAAIFCELKLAAQHGPREKILALGLEDWPSSSNLPSRKLSGNKNFLSWSALQAGLLN